MKRFIPLALFAAGLTVWLGLRGESGDRAKASHTGSANTTSVSTLSGRLVRPIIITGILHSGRRVL